MQLIHEARTQPGTANAEKIRQEYWSINDFKQKNQIRNSSLFQYSALGEKCISKHNQVTFVRYILRAGITKFSDFTIT